MSKEAPLVYPTAPYGYDQPTEPPPAYTPMAAATAPAYQEQPPKMTQPPAGAPAPSTYPQQHYMPVPTAAVSPNQVVIHAPTSKRTSYRPYPLSILRHV